MIDRPSEPSLENGYTKSDILDGKVFSKSSAMPTSRVLQEQHLVSDRNRTNLSQHATPSQRAGYYKENLIIPNYNHGGGGSEHFISDRHSGVSYVRGKLLGKVSNTHSIPINLHFFASESP